jgi:radical SAM protein with 4Fe4S-binding SPASM domain
MIPADARRAVATGRGGAAAFPRDGHAGRRADMILAREQVKFGHAKNETLPQSCRECPFLSDGWGECPKKTHPPHS